MKVMEFKMTVFPMMRDDDDGDWRTLRIPSYNYEIITKAGINGTGWDGVWMKCISLSIGTS
jgi:hypothetical protein